jgi:16S rRNA (guanine(966)-N(2))-methyltransferase RsmD
VRVIGGTLRGRKLSPLRGLRIRPTSDYVRESIFNILADFVGGAVVLDLFAGTGSLGIEALSRGATSAVFVDKHPLAIKILIRNISACLLQEQSTLLRRDIFRDPLFLKAMGRTFDLIFVDPPYGKGFVERTLHLLDRSECIAKGACVAIEHSIHERLPQTVAHFEQTSGKQHGNTLVSFYECVL